YERQIQIVRGNGGNQFGQYAGQIVENQNRYNAVQNVGNQNVNRTRNGNVVAAWAGGNGNGNNGDIDEIKEVNANCILMINLQQASTSEEQYTDLLEHITEPHQVQQNDNNVISKGSSVELSGE
ncbi:hypothetical protein Tco_1452723, partial [Tanacetum coccineum]